MRHAQYKQLLILGTFLAAVIMLGGIALSTSQPAFAAPSSTPQTVGVPESCAPNWTHVNTPNPRTHHYVNDIDVIAPNDIWAVGEYYNEQNYTPDTGLTMHWDGVAWTIVPTPPLGQRVELQGVSAIASHDVWAVGLYYPGGPYLPVTMHWDGAAWTIVPSPEQAGGLLLNDVVALAANDVWAVGANDGFHSAIAMHWNGSQWTIVPTPRGGGFSDDNVLEAVSAISSTDIWAVGYIYPEGGTQRTLAMRWNGSQWSLVTTPNPGNYVRSLYGVTAIASNNVWAVGTYSYNSGETYIPLFLRWNGTQWVHVTGPDFPDYSVLRDVTAVSANDIWAVGTNAGCNFCLFETLIMHWDGAAWSRVYSPNGSRYYSRLYGVAAVSSDDVWAVGFSDNSGYPYNSDSLVLRHLCPETTPTPIATGTAATATRTTTLVPTGTATAIATGTTTRTATTTMATSTPLPPTATRASTSTPMLATSTPTSTQTIPTSTPTQASASSTPNATAIATTTACAIRFSDVPQGHTFYPFVRCLACQNILGGYDDGTFRPDNLITRGQIAKIVSNAAGLNDDPGEQVYEDVPVGNAFYVWVNRLSSRGYMGGYPCGTLPSEPCGADNKPYFRPFANATRGQIAKIVSNAAGYSDTPTGQMFEDVATDHAFYVWIQRLASRGIMGGYPCGGVGEPCGIENRPYFRPFNNATRGQTAKIVSSAFFPTCNP